MRKPKFNKKAPKHWVRFFSAKSDETFKRAHPIGYWVLVAIGIIAFVLPLVIYNIILDVYDAPNSAWIVLGLLGCLVMGVGLFNIVAAWIGQYLGHAVTLITLIGGGILVGASILLIFNRTLYEFFNQELLTFNVGTLMFMLLLLLFYGLFRYAVNYWLTCAKKLRARDIEHMKKGKKNYWWYETIHREIGMGAIYYLNKAATILYALTILLTVLFGWILVVSIPICIFSMLIYLLMTVMTVFARIQNNLEEHGKPFVLIAKNHRQGVDSILFDVISIAVILVIGYAHFLAFAGLWGISLPHL